MKKILLVDDSKTVNKILTAGLVSSGYEVISVHDVDSAIEALKTDGGFTIKLVITDLIMPGKDGNDLINYLHTATIGTRPRIIAISGGSQDTVDAGTAVSTVKNRVERVLTKPFTQPVLLATVRDLIGQ